MNIIQAKSLFSKAITESTGIIKPDIEVSVRLVGSNKNPAHLFIIRFVGGWASNPFTRLKAITAVKAAAVDNNVKVDWK